VILNLISIMINDVFKDELRQLFFFKKSRYNERLKIFNEIRAEILLLKHLKYICKKIICSINIFTKLNCNLNNNILRFIIIVRISILLFTFKHLSLLKIVNLVLNTSSYKLFHIRFKSIFSSFF